MYDRNLVTLFHNAILDVNLLFGLCSVFEDEYMPFRFDVNVDVAIRVFDKRICGGVKPKGFLLS